MLYLIKVTELIEERNKLLKAKNTIEKELGHLPKGNLQCTKNHYSYQYYIDGKYTSRKKLKLVQAISKRQYYEKLLKVISPLIKNIDKVITAYKQNIVDSVYHNLNDGRKELLGDTIYITVEQLISDFNSQTFELFENQCTIDSDLYTNKHEHVRSKSEKIIADELFRRDIPYKYEMPLILYDGTRKYTVHPDFTSLNKTTGNKIIMELFGMMDDPDYAEKAIRKIRLYEKNGYVLGKNFIAFFETKNVQISVTSLDLYINEFLI